MQTFPAQAASCGHRTLNEQILYAVPCNLTAKIYKGTARRLLPCSSRSLTPGLLNKEKRDRDLKHHSRLTERPIQMLANISIMELCARTVLKQRAWTSVTSTKQSRGQHNKGSTNGFSHWNTWGVRMFLQLYCMGASYIKAVCTKHSFYKCLHMGNRVMGKWLHRDFSVVYPAVLTASPALAKRLRWLLEINFCTIPVIKSVRDQKQLESLHWAELKPEHRMRTDNISVERAEEKKQRAAGKMESCSTAVPGSTGLHLYQAEEVPINCLGILSQNHKSLLILSNFCTVKLKRLWPLFKSPQRHVGRTTHVITKYPHFQALQYFLYCLQTWKTSSLAVKQSDCHFNIQPHGKSLVHMQSACLAPAQKGSALLGWSTWNPAWLL